jgi:aromatic amino acid aminotransferase I
MSPPCAIEVEAITDTEGYTVPDPFFLPLKVNEIRNRRKIHQRSQWGVAAPSSSDQFKHIPGLKNKPKAKRWDR